MISIIVAMTKKRVIGRNNALPWRIPDELKNFKKITTGHTVLMGRKTFESIGRPLPNRRNIVISSSYAADGIEVVHSLQDALSLAKNDNDVFIIGGSRVFSEALPIADKMFISHVKKEYDGDIFFPEVDFSQWSVESKQDFPEFELVVYKRK